MASRNTFTTSDVNLSAFISARGDATFCTVKWEQPEKAVFHFSPGPKEDAAAAFANNAPAPAQSLLAALKFLRTRMNETRPSR